MKVTCKKCFHKKSKRFFFSQCD